jgi:transposase
MKMQSELPTDIVVLHKLVLEQDETIRRLREQLLLALRRQFGPRSEQVSVDQLPLFESDATAIIPPAPEADDEKKNTERPKGSRRGLCSQGLPREIREVDIPEDAKVCPCCAGRLHAFGFDASEQVHYVPAILKVIETRRLKYSCHRCHEGVLRAPADKSSPIPKSMASASLIAYLAVCKFADHQPAFRVAAQFRRMGVELSDALMSDWLIPGGIWNYEGFTPMAAMGRIVESVGGYIAPHAQFKTLIAQPRYPELPWHWDARDPDRRLPLDIVKTLNLRWEEKPFYNGIYVSGERAGITGRVIRTGSAGDVLAPMIIDGLITHADAARERGRSVLANVGKQAMVTLELPMMSSLGLIDPGQLLAFGEGSTLWKGLVRSTRINADWSDALTIRQTLELERHYL